MQLPLLVDVKVNVIEPAVSSAALGVQIAFKSVEDGENDPVPELVQFPVVVPPVIVPPNVTKSPCQII